jgi:toxin ParE1/3/4
VIVAVTAEAEYDLEQITTYIAEQSIEIALNFVQELREKCESLADAPRGYPLVPRHEHLGIRRRPFGNYSIFNRMGTSAIEVVHILHSARDYERLLFPETWEAHRVARKERIATPRPPVSFKIMAERTDRA